MTITKLTPINRIRGSLLGLAVGDALGAPIEFQPPGTFTPVTTYQSGGPHRLPAGYWTDDTSLALCLATSLADHGWNPADQIRRYDLWYRTGYLSSTGECFDIGNTTWNALQVYEQTGQIFAGSPNPKHSGNGSLMRLAPVPLLWYHDLPTAIRYSGEQSRTTHGSLLAVDACRWYGSLIAGAVQGVPLQELLDPRWGADIWEETPLCPEVEAIRQGSYLRHPVRGSGFVISSLEASVWAVATSSSFSESVLRAVNLGDDADTTGAITGQLAGALFGDTGIDADWLHRLHDLRLLDQVLDYLMAKGVSDAKN